MFLKNLIRGSNLKLSNDSRIQEFMNFFQADEYGHEADIGESDLGYGWMHYSMIRLTKPKRILCVGSRHGYIPAILAQACKENKFGHVDFVDAGYGENDKSHWTGVGFWKTQEGGNIFNGFGLGKYISTFIQTTAEFTKKYPQNKYSYIYIDADHSYKGIAFDYKKTWPMLVRGGFMSFHDISIKEKKPEGNYGVWKLWDKLEKTNTTIKFPFSGSGLGIIQKT